MKFNCSCKAKAANSSSDYNYDDIVRSFWKTGFYTGKLDLVGAIMQWSDGKLNPETILEAFERIKSEDFEDQNRTEE
jgi:hypothetical protein